MLWMAMIVVGGVLTGSFALPMKYTPKWKWEHTWAAFGVWTLLVIPWAAGLASVPHLGRVLVESGPAVVLGVFGLGCLWGVSSVAFGFGIHYLGLGLGYSLMMGMIIVLGSLAPLFDRGGASISSRSLAAVVGGVAVILVGVGLSGWAAVLRQRDQTGAASAAETREKRSVLTGFIVCVIAGVTAPMLNLAFVCGETIRERAVELGASATLAPNAVWAVALLGGFVVNLLYTLTLVERRGTWRTFTAPGTGIYYGLTLLMGLLWASSIIVYGMAAANLGALGTSAGWAAFNAVGILWANCLGWLTHEWKGVKRTGMFAMQAGLVVLLLGVLLMGLAKAT
jgi:L-rhamnose-H+ transport protein